MISRPPSLLATALGAALLLGGCDGLDGIAASAETAETAAQCFVPPDLAVATTATPPDRTPDAPATGHVLAMSWSPEFCRFRSDQPQHRGQCQDNRFGLIVHGLWPQAGRGPHPRACALAQPVPAPVLTAHYCMIPSAALMQHEWAAHGTCAWQEPDAYFADAAELWDRYRRPDLFRLSRQDGLSAGDVRSAFSRANPNVADAAIGLKINARGWLEEVYLCLDLDYAPRRCNAREAGPSAGTPISIWRGG